MLRFCCRPTPTGRGDGPGNCGGVFVPCEDGGEYSPALRAGGVRQGAGTQAARHVADAEDSRRRIRGADHRLASRATTEGLRQLEFAVAGASCGRAGDCRVGQPGNAPTDAKKNRICQRKIAYWVIPPDADAEFAAHMEEVLETYARPLDSGRPVLCMDEQPVQLVRETRTPMPATRDRPRRVDCEYERAGTASVFMFCEPLSGWRQATARPRRTKGAFYERFEPQRVRALVRHIVFGYTPRHGSWLNIAECELSAMTRQCLNGRRLGDLETLCSEIAAWSTDVSRRQRGVDWQMDIDGARRKLKSIRASCNIPDPRGPVSPDWAVDRRQLCAWKPESVEFAVSRRGIENKRGTFRTSGQASPGRSH